MRSFALHSASLAVLFAVPARAAPTASPELLDYLIQDVCVDAADRAVTGDPALCPAHRDIRLSEPTPYLVTDVDHANADATYFAFASFPVRGADGTVKVMHTKSGQGHFGADYTFSYDPARDGYDLTDLSSSSWASFVRTSDGGCFDQIWSGSGRAETMADRAGGWILFPLGTPPSAWPATSSARTRTHHVQLTPGVAGCGNGSSPGRTFWNAPARYQFETGKRLTAIRSDHFANHALSRGNNALERFYFTREYGLTRWEAWMPQSRCLAEHGADAAICHPENAETHPLRGRCSVLNQTATGTPGLDQWGGQPWVRVDCRDETNYVALDTPQVMLNGAMARGAGHDDLVLP